MLKIRRTNMHQVLKIIAVLQSLSLGHGDILDFSLRPCNESVSFVKLCYLSNVTKTYIPGLTDYYASKVPTTIQTIVSSFELVDIDEIKDTVTVNMEFAVYWNDTRLSINQPQPTEKNVDWYEIVEPKVIDQIYVPRVKFNSLQGLKSLHGWGPKVTDYFWFAGPHNLQFMQTIQVKLFCTFQFSSFPFDHHYCDMTFGTKSTTTLTTYYSHTIIKDAWDNIVNTHISKVNQSKLPFEIHLQILEPYNISMDGLPYPYTGIRIHMKRDSLGLLYGGFYGPTGLFSLLSLTSYTINPDAVLFEKAAVVAVISLGFSFQVPGRLGVLVTLYLIAFNVYGSVKGPPDRGFSFIEVWMVGIQFPILAAIVEYGVILVIKKYQLMHQNDVHPVQHYGRGMNIDQLAVKMDKWAFIFSLTFIILFGLVYFGMAALELEEKDLSYVLED